MLCCIFPCKDSSIKYQFTHPLFGGLTKITKARYKHEVCLVATGKNKQRDETKVCTQKTIKVKPSSNFVIQLSLQTVIPLAVAGRVIQRCTHAVTLGSESISSFALVSGWLEAE